MVVLPGAFYIEMALQTAHAAVWPGSTPRPGRELPASDSSVPRTTPLSESVVTDSTDATVALAFSEEPTGGDGPTSTRQAIGRDARP